MQKKEKIFPSTDVQSEQILAIREKQKRRLLELEEVSGVNVDVSERIKDLVKDEFIVDVMKNIDQLPQPAKKAARNIY